MCVRANSQWKLRGQMGQFSVEINSEMLWRHVAGIDEPAARLKAAHAFLDELIRPHEKDLPPQTALRFEASIMRKKAGAVLYHDELGDCWEPQALIDVARAAAAHGLQFLGDAGEGPVGDGFLRPEVTDTSTETVVRDAQISDDLSMRYFRQSLFVRGELKPARHFHAALLSGLYVSCDAARTADGTVRNKRGTFQVSDQSEALIDALIDAWPQRLALRDFINGADLAEFVLIMFESGLIDLHSAPAPCSDGSGDHPAASPLARAQVSDGQTMICTLLHTIIRVNEDGPRTLVGLLDGQSDRTAMAEAWSQTPYADAMPFDTAVALAGKLGLLKP